MSNVPSIDNVRRRTPTQASGGRVPPHNLDAERSLIGAVLQRPDLLADVRADLTPEDFYNPAHGHAWDAICRVRARGGAIEVVGVVDELARMGLLDACGGDRGVADLHASAPSYAVKRFSTLVVEHAALRRLISTAGEIAEIGYSVPDDVADAIDQARLLLDGVDLPTLEAPGDLYELDEFLNRPKVAEGREWLVPGLIRRRWRTVIVAPEGSGKTVVLRAMAIGAASGVHPFQAPGFYEPVRALIVDLENPEDVIDETCIPIREAARKKGEWAPGRAFIWHREAGIDIRRRSDRAAFEAVLREAQPDLVCMGPLYKSFHRSRGEDNEIAAEEVQAIFDDLRTRFDFALVLEHHAPKAQGTNRDMNPFGSQRWLAWPELGVTLNPVDEKDPSTLRVGRFRYDRVKCAWPGTIERSSPWPWLGTWPEGMTDSGRV